MKTQDSETRNDTDTAETHPAFDVSTYIPWTRERPYFLVDTGGSEVSALNDF